MRRLLLLTLAVWLAFGAGAALADVTILANISKVKDKVVVEEIDKLKQVFLDVVIEVTATKFTESDTIVNQLNSENFACENCAEKRDQIVGSGNDNSGVVTINQAAGNMNNQGSAISIAVDVPEDPDPSNDPANTAFAESQAAVDQRNLANVIESINILFREATIEGSLNNNAGVVHVNQAPGQMNNQANALSVAISLDAGVALSEADLGQFNTGNSVTETNVLKTAAIVGSVNGNSGVVGINQSSGNMANQANVVSIAVAQLP